MENQLLNVTAHLSTIVLGKEKEIKLALACLLSKGHLLIEDLPGMGKTTLAHALANALGLSYQRTQFTSDLLPADIIGVSIFDEKSQSFKLHQGPLFNQVVLADEINRASPKTQSALLEAMEDRQISIDNQTYPLPTPFFVIATQNPLFHSGTYPLPESQLDRFTMRLSLGFPSVEAERQILSASNIGNNFNNDKNLEGVINAEQLLAMQKEVQQVNCEANVIDYVIALCNVTRQPDFNGNPLSPRAGKALIASAKAWAYLHQRDFVLPDDIQTVFIAVCEHRLDAGYTDAVHGKLAQQVIAQVDVLNPLNQ